ncbi:MAG TPA: lytic transglycosylase domain-containing protein [Pyrinomonadaceae bacterium]|nr:lytic transglycosylase domain-containing protein [Pyrinomonadaceae bacterium]
MKRALVVILLVLILFLAAYAFNRYWTHRFDPLIARQASIYRVDPDLVWSIIYEETYFSPWKTGKDGEIGLMQVTPAVGREWATETGMREFERQMNADPESLLRDPERNIQIGCWYLEKIYEQFRDSPEIEVRMIAAYNAGPSRAAEWSRVDPAGSTQSGADFINRIDIPSTKAYVISIMQRYRQVKNSRTSSTVLQEASPVK